jgi:hypothetical protein
MKFRIYRNAEANFNDLHDLDNHDLHYTDAWFEKLRAHGFTGLWLNGWMRKLVAFREAENSELVRNQDILKRLMERAARFDVGVYLFLNEPKAFPRRHRIWQRFPNMRGAPGTWPYPKPGIETYLLCTSTEEGRAYVYEMARRLHQALPGLAGTIHINASESPTHCYCHTITNPGGKVFSSNQEHEGQDCPRCAQRTPGDVIAEVLNLYRRGCRDAGSRAPVIAWNWNWIMYAPHPQEDLIRRLDPDINVMADFECGGMAPILGKERLVNEYSLIYVGPSERYTAITTCAARHGHRISAKLQLGTTHEMGTVANMPLVGHIYDKLAYLRGRECEGIFGTWNFGNRFTLNTAAAGRFFGQPGTGKRAEFLADLARDYLGIADGRGFAAAVATIEDAFRCYPLCNQLIYFGPMNFALALPLDDAPLAGKPLTVSCYNLERGDRWEDSLGPFTLGDVIGALDAMAVRLKEGAAAWEALLFPSGSPFATCLKHYQGPPVIPRHSDRVADRELADDMQRRLPAEAFCDLPELKGVTGLHRLQEWSNAWYMLACVESAARVYKNYQAKRERHPGYAAYLRSLQAEERQTLEYCLPLLRLDARLGLHLECQEYFVTAELLERKLSLLKAEAPPASLGELT